MIEGIRILFSRSEEYKDLSWRDARKLRAAAHAQSLIELERIREHSAVNLLDLEMGIESSFYRDPEAPSESQ